MNTNFTSLTVTFELENGDPFVVMLGPGDFGPPDDSHAFVITPAGAELVSGSAVIAEDVTPPPPNQFNLSHTCPATVTPTPTDTSTPTPTDTSTPTPTDTMTPTPTDTMTPTPTDTPTGTPTDTPTGTPTDTPSETPTESETPAGPSLPKTGGFGTGEMALVGLFLLFAGAAILTWRTGTVPLAYRRRH